MISLANVFANTTEACVDFCDYPDVLKEAISIGKRIQDPLVELSQLCGPENDILCGTTPCRTWWGRKGSWRPSTWSSSTGSMRWGWTLTSGFSLPPILNIPAKSRLIRLKVLVSPNIVRIFTFASNFTGLLGLLGPRLVSKSKFLRSELPKSCLLAVHWLFLLTSDQLTGNKFLQFNP